MRLLNQLFTCLSGVIIVTAFTFGVANANNEYAMVVAEQSSAEAYAKAYAAEKVAREEAYAKAEATIEKADETIAKAETARRKEKAAMEKAAAARAEAYAKAHAAWAQSIAEEKEKEKADRTVSYKRTELKELSTH